MKKLIRLTESELKKIIKNVINEASPALAKPGTPPAPLTAPTFSMKTPELKFTDVPQKKSSPAPVAPPKTIFGVGDKDPKILQFQKNLVALGYNVGKKGADGIFGPATEAAVKDFQQKYGIKVSGRVGPPTMRKLAEVVKSKSETKPFDPNAEWNKDRAYTNTPQSPTQATKTDTTPQTPIRQPEKSGGSGILTQKLRNKSNTRKPSDWGGKYKEWYSKHGLY